MEIIFFDVLSRDFQAAKITLLSHVLFFMSIEAVHRLSIAAKKKQTWEGNGLEHPLTIIRNKKIYIYICIF